MLKKLINRFRRQTVICGRVVTANTHVGWVGAPSNARPFFEERSPSFLKHQSQPSDWVFSILKGEVPVSTFGRLSAEYREKYLLELLEGIERNQLWGADREQAISHAARLFYAHAQSAAYEREKP